MTATEPDPTATAGTAATPPIGTPAAALPAGARRRSSRRSGGIVALSFGVLLLAFNLRPAITSLPPIFPQLHDRLGLSSTAVTVLATLPVLCFGVFSAVAARIARRFGEERTLGAAVVLVALGLAARAAFPHALLLAGTVLACGAIALMNVLLSSLIKRRAPERASLLMSLYLLMLNGGAIAGSAIPVPVLHASHSMPLTLGLCAAPAIVAAVVWLPQLGRGSAAPNRRPVGARHTTRVHRHALAWQVTAFMGLQSLTYYATLSFLPDLFVGRGLPSGEAGLVGSMLGVGGVVAAGLTPIVVNRVPRLERPLTIACALECGICIGVVLVVPVGLTLPLMVLLGLGQGAGIALALHFLIARSATPSVAASLSGLAQSGGYLLAATGPLAVGLLHSATGGWTPSVAVLLGCTAAELVAGMLAARHRVIPDAIPELGRAVAAASGGPAATP